LRGEGWNQRDSPLRKAEGLETGNDGENKYLMNLLHIENTLVAEIINEWFLKRKKTKNYQSSMTIRHFDI